MGGKEDLKNLLKEFDEDKFIDSITDYKKEEEIRKGLILVAREDLEYLQFIIENKGIYDDISPGDYKWLKNFRERYLNDE